MTMMAPGPGINLATGLPLDLYYDAIRDCFYGCFAKECRRADLDPEDVLQEVYKSILVRNQGKNPFDPTKGKAAVWIFMVCRGVTRNQIEKAQRRQAFDEAVGAEEDIALTLELQPAEEQELAEDIEDEDMARLMGRAARAWMVSEAAKLRAKSRSRTRQAQAA